MVAVRTALQDAGIVYDSAEAGFAPSRLGSPVPGGGYGNRAAIEQRLAETPYQPGGMPEGPPNSAFSVGITQKEMSRFSYNIHSKTRRFPPPVFYWGKRLPP